MWLLLSAALGLGALWGAARERPLRAAALPRARPELAPDAARAPRAELEAPSPESALLPTRSSALALAPEPARASLGEDESLLSVRVLRADGTPAAFARVSAQRLARADEPAVEPVVQPGARTHGGRTDREGVLVLHVEPGRWSVRACEGPSTHPGSPSGLAHAEVLLAGCEERALELRLAARLALEVRVRDAHDGRAIAGAEVRLDELDGPLGAYTDAAGACSIELRGDDFPRRVLARAQGYVPAELEPRELGRVELELVPSLVLSGRLSPAPERGRTRAYVSVLGARSESERLRPGAQLVLGEDGSFESFPLSSEARHLLVVEAPGFARATRTLEPARGTLELGTLVLEPEAALRGELVDARGERLPQAQLTLIPLDHATPGAGCSTQPSDARGEFAFEHLASGWWRLRVRRGPGPEQALDLFLGPGESWRRIVLE